MSNAATNRYKDKHYDRIGLLVPKGKKELLKQAASEAGYSSLSAWICSILQKSTGIELALLGELPTLKK